MEKLIFSSIKNGEIFEPEFQSLDQTGRGEIEFKKSYVGGGIAVVYAPNGTGKTSFTEVVSAEKSTDSLAFAAQYGNTAISPESKQFHVIRDQIARNVIHGNTSDYLVGANIRKEYELKQYLNERFGAAFSKSLPDAYKSSYKLSKVKDWILKKIQDTDRSAYKFILNIVNQRSRGKDIDRDEFINFITNPNNKRIVQSLDQEKTQFVINDLGSTKIVEKLVGITSNTIVFSGDIPEMERHDDAIGLLKKYGHLNTCIVCDNHNFNGGALLNQKSERRRVIYESLDEQTKSLLEKVVKEKSLQTSDPFSISEIVMQFISTGDDTRFIELQEQLNLYVANIVNAIINATISVFDNTDVLAKYREYKQILASQPQIDNEELLFIKQVISDNIEKEITIERDTENDNNFKLMLAGKEFLNVERNELHLSTGEQNFISLAFELLLARHSGKAFVVLDDPISSFDSVYKNKIAFCIVKFLEKQKQIILTHNTDLIRLLNVQLNNCFNLYMLCNSEGGKNGFIPVKQEEKDILINLYELIKLLQNKDGHLLNCITNQRLFLMSMIPFMRGYAHISKDGNQIYTDLSQVMHGYETATVDVAAVYNSLFGDVFETSESISVDDVLAIDCLNLSFFDATEYPLFADTLKQTLIYYHLRMKVERELIDIYQIPIRAGDILMLNQIIGKAFRSLPNDPDFEDKRENRVFFTSRKTLLNEFNHFEGNMNIFQPAIDIESSALQREINQINGKLLELRRQHGR